MYERLWANCETGHARRQRFASPSSWMYCALLNVNSCTHGSTLLATGSLLWTVALSARGKYPFLELRQKKFNGTDITKVVITEYA
eukprot:9225005-Pyramimonas_sp.AAC.1